MANLSRRTTSRYRRAPHTMHPHLQVQMAICITQPRIIPPPFSLSSSPSPPPFPLACLPLFSLARCSHCSFSSHAPPAPVAPFSSLAPLTSLLFPYSPLDPLSHCSLSLLFSIFLCSSYSLLSLLAHPLALRYSLPLLPLSSSPSLSSFFRCSFFLFP